jgi:hypothetical protein
MESAKYSALPVVAHGRLPAKISRFYPVSLTLILCAGIAFFLLRAPDAALAPAAEVGPHQIDILREACQLRFWKNKALPYCARASWIHEITAEEKPPLNVFEVYTPPRAYGNSLAGGLKEQAEFVATTGGKKKEECQQVLMQHVFDWSYGKPFVGDYNSPTDCAWTNVLFNLTMTSQGRQFDRLGHLFLGDIEVWRTSTAEPTSHGIVFSYVKDMTHLTALLRQPQKIIFDLGNLVDDVYTGSFNATLTATFYTPLPIAPPKPADLILPITAKKGAAGQPSHFHLPSERAIAQPVLPQNTIRAVLSISASGNADEEFWYTNVPSEYSRTFGDDVLPGYGPFRELQVLIDSQPAGFVWPEITIFTGGLVPSLWRPIVAPGTFDLPEYDVDITPFLPVLLDGEEHTIEIGVASYNTETNTVARDIGTDWLISGRLHIWTDPLPTWHTTGILHQLHVPSPQFTFSPALTTENGANTTLQLQLSASRNLVALSTLSTSAGNVTAAWMQGLHWSSFMHISSSGRRQLIFTSAAGTENTVAFGARSWKREPLVLDMLFTPEEDAFTLSANVRLAAKDTGAGRWADGAPISQGERASQLAAQARWRSDQGGSGTLRQVWGEVRALRDAEGVASYGRAVTAVDGGVREDLERVNGVLGMESVERVLKGNNWVVGGV